MPDTRYSAVDMMSETHSLVRARHLQEWLAAVEQEQDPWRARFFAAIPPDMRSLIDNATKVAWLPAVFHVKLADILADSLGAVRAHAYYRRAFAASLRGPVLGPLVHTGVALLGVTPAAAVRCDLQRVGGELSGLRLVPGRGARSRNGAASSSAIYRRSSARPTPGSTPSRHRPMGFTTF